LLVFYKNKLARFKNPTAYFPLFLLNSIESFSINFLPKFSKKSGRLLYRYSGT
jgi:hypothetical protein